MNVDWAHLKLAKGELELYSLMKLISSYDSNIAVFEAKTILEPLTTLQYTH